MKLKKGILIHNQMEEGYDAIRINSGTIFHEKHISEHVDFNGTRYVPKYDSNAYIAKRDWRKLSSEQINYTRSIGKRNDYNTVYLGDIPVNLKECFQELNLATSINREEVFEKLSNNAGRTKEISSELESFLLSISNSKPFHFHCIGTNYPNIEMVACNTTKLSKGFKPQDIKYMGIHNDISKKMTIYTAHKCGNRMSVNLGKDTRSFLFANLSMIQALNMLKQKIDVKEYGVNIYNITKIFFKYFPNYPLLKIDLKPYQYYVAPTDNCFHDGSTFGNTELDITMIYFGNFQY